MLKRYIVELGYGADLHGGDVTKATVRAVKDAVSHSCLCGISDILGIKDPNKMHIHVLVGCTDPAAIDKEAVLAAVPFGTKEIEVIDGGLRPRGLAVPALGEGEHIVVSNVALTVSFDL